MEGLRGIGRMARESGLSISALRFYDGAGVLGPAHVDPDTGYRFYAPEQLVLARLVASLRRVGMPLPGIREVLAHRHDPACVDALLVEHLLRLEQGLDDARRELSSVPTLLFPEEPVMSRITVPAAALVAAVAAVRFAVDGSGRFPAIGGVLLDVTPETLTVVATDRYRLAVATAPVTRLDGPVLSAVVTTAFADALDSLGTDGETTLVIEDGSVTASRGGEQRTGELVDEPYPDYTRLVSPGVERVVQVSSDELRAAVAAGGTRTVRRDEDGVDTPVTVLAVDDTGRLAVGAGLTDGIGVNAEFLLQAVDAGGSGQLALELDGPRTPLLIRPLETDTYSILMPVRL